MRNSYGYNSYRGRSGIRTVLTVLIVVLLIILLLAVGFFVFAQRYVVYYDDGSVHFEFPWTLQAQSTPMPTPEIPTVVVTPEASPEPTPEPTPEPVTLPLLVELPVSSLLDGTANREVASAGGTGALFTMKAESGLLSYVSVHPWAVYAKATQTDSDLNDAIAAALEGDSLYAVAKVSCFKDDTAPYYYGRSNGLRTGSDGNWRDGTGSRWFSPAATAARSYLTDLCLELCALGFDEIWIDYATFPITGNLATIVRGDAYNDDTLAEDLEGFYAQLHGAISQAYPAVKLSITAASTLLTGAEDDPSGQTLEQLKTYADRIYLSPAPEGTDYAAALEELGFSPENVIYFGGEDLPETAGRVITP